MPSPAHVAVPGEVAADFVRHWDSLLAAVIARHLTDTESAAVAALLDALGAPESARAWRDHHGDRPAGTSNWHAPDGSPLLMTGLGAGLERAVKARQAADARIAVLAAAETAYRVLERWPDAMKLVFSIGRWPTARVVTGELTEYPLGDVAPSFRLITVENYFTWRPLCEPDSPNSTYTLPLANALKAGRELMEGRR